MGPNGQYTDSDIGPMLAGLGYQFVSGYGPSAFWKDPSGQTYVQSVIANSILGNASPYVVASPNTLNSAAQDQTSATDHIDGAGVAYTIKNGQAFTLDGQPYMPVPVPVNQHPGDSFSSSTSSSTSFNDTPIQTTQVDPGTGLTYTVLIDPRTGGVISRTQAGFAPLSPAEQFQQQQELQAAQDAAAMARVQAQITGTAGDTAANNAAALARQQLAGQNTLENTTLSGQQQAAMQAANDTQANNRALLTAEEQAHQAQLQAAVNGFQSVNSLAPQLGDLALKNAQFTSDTLSKPADYLARAFFTQGQQSPLPQVSQADVINQLRNNIAGYNGALSGFSASAPGFTLTMPSTAPVASALGAPAAFTAPPGAASAPSAGGGGGANPFAGFIQQAQNQQAAGINPMGAGTPQIPGAAPGLAHGGFTSAPVMVVGDSPDGRPNNTQETVVNPTHAPVGVIPNPATVKKQDPGHAAMAKAIGFVSNPDTQHALVDEMAKRRGLKPAGKTPPKYAQGTGVPRYADGTGIATTGDPVTIGGSTGFTQGPNGAFTFNAPQLPTQTATSQDALQALEASVRPPAVNTLLSGGNPGELQLGFNLPSAMAYRNLSTQDKSALGTTLATQFNEDPSDVEDAITRRYSVGSKGGASTAGF